MIQIQTYLIRKVNFVKPYWFV